MTYHAIIILLNTSHLICISHSHFKLYLYGKYAITLVFPLKLKSLESLKKKDVEDSQHIF